MANAAATTPQDGGLMDAEALQALGPAFVFYRGADLLREYHAIVDALPNWGGPRFHPPAPVSPAKLGDRFAAVLPRGHCPDRDTLRAGLIALGTAERFALETRLHRLHGALAGSRAGAARPRSALFAVPPVWSQRWRLLIAGPLLPVAVGREPY